MDFNWPINKVWEGYINPHDDEELAEAFVETDPPLGEGYQLWENCTEGSPQSPVFKTLDELCTWCEPNATTFA